MLNFLNKLICLGHNIRNKLVGIVGCAAKSTDPGTSQVALADPSLALLLHSLLQLHRFSPGPSEPHTVPLAPFSVSEQPDLHATRSQAPVECSLLRANRDRWWRLPRPQCIERAYANWERRSWRWRWRCRARLLATDQNRAPCLQSPLSRLHLTQERVFWRQHRRSKFNS